jgi:hypothetical protein
VSRKPKHKCIDCGEIGVINAPPFGWLCTDCTQQRVSAPHNIELANADEEAAKFKERGGKLS